jgi:hypothetical protein
LIENNSFNKIEDILRDGMGWQIIIPNIKNVDKNDF